VLDKAVVADAGRWIHGLFAAFANTIAGGTSEIQRNIIAERSSATARLRSPAMTRRVAIAGAALSDCGRVGRQEQLELHYQGTARAVADAGLTKDDVQGFMSTGLGNLPPVEVAEYLGLQPLGSTRPKWAGGAGR